MIYGSEATFLFEATSTKKYLRDYFIYNTILRSGQRKWSEDS